MSDLGSELKNAVLSSTAKTFKAACYYSGEDHNVLWATAKRWFGNLELCDHGEEDILLFNISNQVPSDFLKRYALASIARGSHVFQFDPVECNFVRRDKVWFDHPGRRFGEPEWVWTHIKDNLTEAESDVKFGHAEQVETGGQN